MSVVYLLRTVYQKLMFVYLYKHNGEEFDVEYMQKLLGLKVPGCYRTLQLLEDRLLVVKQYGHRTAGVADKITIDKWDYLILRENEKYNLEIYEKYLEYLEHSDHEDLSQLGLSLIERLILFVTSPCGDRKHSRFPAVCIAKILGIYDETVRRHLKILDKKGFLSAKHREEVCDWKPLKKYKYPADNSFYIKHLSPQKFFSKLYLGENKFLISYFSEREIPYLAREWHFCTKLARKKLKNKNKSQQKESEKQRKMNPNSTLFAKMIQTWNRYNPRYPITDLDRHLCKRLISYCKIKSIEIWEEICRRLVDFLEMHFLGNYCNSQPNSDEYLKQKHWKSKGSEPVSIRLLVRNFTSKLTEESPQKHCKCNENQVDNNRIKSGRTRIKNIRCLILYALNFNVTDRILRVFGLSWMKYSKLPKQQSEEEIKAREEIISEIISTTEEDEIKCLRLEILKKLGPIRYRSIDASNLTFTKGPDINGRSYSHIYVKSSSLFRSDYAAKKLVEIDQYKFSVDPEERENKIMEELCYG